MKKNKRNQKDNKKQDNMKAILLCSVLMVVTNIPNRYLNLNLISKKINTIIVDIQHRIIENIPKFIKSFKEEIDNLNHLNHQFLIGVFLGFMIFLLCNYLLDKKVQKMIDSRLKIHFRIKNESKKYDDYLKEFQFSLIEKKIKNLENMQEILYDKYLILSSNDNINCSIRKENNSRKISDKKYYLANRDKILKKKREQYQLKKSRNMAKQ